MSNPKGNVSVMKNLDPHDLGAIFARISRAPYSVRGTLLQEYVNSKGQFDVQKAEKVFDRVLNQFGDDSVGQLGGAHIYFTWVSMLATKVIEDLRIGGEPLEESTRYVEFDKKVNWDFLGKNDCYRYHVPEELTGEVRKKYVKYLNHFFDLYTEMLPKMRTYIIKNNLLENFETIFEGKTVLYKELVDEKKKKETQRAYNMAVKAQVCDIIRCVLPAATTTTLGIRGNGQFFTRLITKLWTFENKEFNVLGNEIKKELDTLMPAFVKRSKIDDYLLSINTSMEKIFDKYFSNIEKKDTFYSSWQKKELREVILYHHCKDKQIERLSAMLFPYLQLSTWQIRDVLVRLNDSERKEIETAYLGERKTRRHRTGRGLEWGYPYQFDIIAAFAEYRDLQRHRMMSQQRQKITPHLGFSMPQEIIEIGYEDKVKRCIEMSKELYTELCSVGLDHLAEYVTLFNHQLRFNFSMNERQLQHLCELRSQKQGHTGYRIIAQEMAKQALLRDSWLSESLKFVNYKHYLGLCRAEAEAKQSAKNWKLIK